MIALCCVLGAAALLALRWRFPGADAPAAAPRVTGRADTLTRGASPGGADGGAVSISGVPESRINLDIVLKLDQLLGFCGQSPVLLRREDISLHDDTAVSLREKKASDLKNRAEAVRSVEGGTLLSIHQNSYPDGRYRGAQTFYAPTAGSRELAEHIQAALIASLQPENSRQAKAVAGSVYLMNHVDCPAVLVECGFLTNPEEEALLRDEKYQRRLALVLASAWLTAPDAGEEAPAP